MGKAKTFAEKMLKNLKDVDENVSYKVIKPRKSNKGAYRFQKKVVVVHKGQDENKMIGL